VPGLAALNAGGDAGVTSVSCPATGACSADGDYTDGSGEGQGFVVTQTAGTWGTAIGVPGLAGLEGTSGNASLASLSCASPGNCAAGGSYLNSAGLAEAFVVNETGGTWASAEQVAGTAGSLPATPWRRCPARPPGPAWPPGTGDGLARPPSSPPNAPVSGARPGRFWGSPRSAARPGPDSSANSVSCSSAGPCAVTGWYYDPVTQHDQAFAASRRSGAWRQAIEIPGIALLDGGHGSAGATVSCATAGNCVIGGSYVSTVSEGFVADEVDGSWRSARQLPGLARLDAGHNAAVVSVSCAAAGRCAAGGYYAPRPPVTPRRGSWPASPAAPGAGRSRCPGWPR
jgi:hypothetical protein